jgi:hypothetical protein
MNGARQSETCGGLCRHYPPQSAEPRICGRRSPIKPCHAPHCRRPRGGGGSITGHQFRRSCCRRRLILSMDRRLREDDGPCFGGPGDVCGSHRKKPHGRWPVRFYLAGGLPPPQRLSRRLSSRRRTVRLPSNHAAQWSNFRSAGSSALPHQSSRCRLRAGA